jgi:conjugative relaxase-like TrwC/TraI family protein
MAKIRNGDSYLETHLSANDYYSENESIGGVWVGRGAELLGISGNEISNKDEAFEMLRNNQHPLTELKLTKRNKTTRNPTFDEARKSLCQKLRIKGDLKSDVDIMPSNEEIEAHRKNMKPICNRVAFFDFQCGCAKSVSIMAIVGGDDRLRTAHEEATAVGLRELESLAARRVDVLGKKHLQFTGNIAAAVFQHDSSRALDPQLHTHCVVANATFDEVKQEWVALSEFEMLKAIRYAGKVYQNELARRVKALGYDIVERRNEKGFIEGFEIDGVSNEIMKLFSKRRAVIEKEIEAFKEKVGRLPSPAEISVLTRESRESKKLTEISTEKVRKKQKAQLEESEFYSLSFLKISALKKVEEMKVREDGATQNVASRKEAIALESAMSHLFERSSTLSNHQILAEALNQQLGFVELEELKKEVSNVQKEGSLLELLSDPNPLASLYTSKEHFEHETWAVNFVNASCGKRPKLLFEEPVASEWLAKEQSDAVKFICGMKDAVCAVRGIAGAGKTTMLKELHGHLEKERHQLLYLAPTASAVDVLKKEGFLNATTVSEYLAKAEQEPWHHAVIVIDESGLKSTKQGYEVLKLAQARWQRIVLVGDSKQHVSVEAGDFLRLLETHSKMKSNELKEIRRQIPEKYREAIGLMAQGRSAEALEEFDKMGWINESGAEYLENAAKDYLERSEFALKMDEVIAVAPTWKENFSFTDGIRSGLKERSVLKDGVVMDVVSSLQWTKRQKEQISNYKEGYVVTPSKKIGKLEKGASYVVEKIEIDSDGNKNNGQVFLTGGYELPLKMAISFDVGLKRQIEVSPGDKILLQANDRKNGLINGKVVTVESVQADGALVMSDGLVVPSTYRQFTHGYVVTSHKSQGKTADHVVVAATKLDEKAAYVATSRGRMSCCIHTPDKNHLIAAAKHSSLRVGVLDAKELMPSYNKKVIDSVNQEAIFEQQSDKRIVPEKIDLPSSAERFDLFSIPQKLRSMHPIKRQGVRIRSFATRMLQMMPKPVRVTLSSSMRMRLMQDLSVKQRKNYDVRW